MPSNPLFYAHNLLDFMANLHISFQLYNHIPVFTVAEANDVSLKIPGTHTRNLFLRDKHENMFLITLRHDTLLDLKKLSDLLGVGRFSFGSPERLWTYLGVKPGSVTPFAILNDSERQVKLVLEEEMMNSPLVNFHPLDNSMTIGLAPSELMTILKKQDIKPLILDLNPARPDEEIPC